MSLRWGDKQELLYRNYFEQIIMVTKSDLLIEIGFGRHGFFMVSMLNSSGSRQGSSPGSVLCF